MTVFIWFVVDSVYKLWLRYETRILSVHIYYYTTIDVLHQLSQNSIKRTKVSTFFIKRLFWCEKIFWYFARNDQNLYRLYNVHEMLLTISSTRITYKITHFKNNNKKYPFFSHSHSSILITFCSHISIN